METRGATAPGNRGGDGGGPGGWYGSADYKEFGAGQESELLPLSTGYEVAGVILALGPDTEIASGGGAVGPEVVVFQIFDGYSSALNAPAAEVFAKPSRLSFRRR